MNKFVRKAFSHRYLLLTNMTISLGLSCAGDVLEQCHEIYKGDITKWDPVRTKNMSLSGLVTGAITHWWYNLLERKYPEKTLRKVMIKVVLDQIICSPFVIAAFFVSVALLEGSSLDVIGKEIRQKGYMLYVAEWVIWPPAQFINFYFLPYRYRLLFDSTVSLFYDMYTSYVKNSVPLVE